MMEERSKMRRFLCVTAVVAAAPVVGCVGTPSVQVFHVTEGNKETLADKQGVLYALPKTVVRAQVTVSKKTLKQGELWKFADTDFCAPTDDKKPNTQADANAEKPEDTTKTLCPEGPSPSPIVLPKPIRTKGAESYITYRMNDLALSSYPEPDPEHVYLVEILGSATEKRSLVTKLSDLGFLVEGEVEVYDRTLEISVAGLEAVAGILGKAAATFGAPGLKAVAQTPVGPEARAKALREKLDTVRDDREFYLRQPGHQTAPETIAAVVAEFDKLERAILNHFYTEKEEFLTLTFDVRVDEFRDPEKTPLTFRLVNATKANGLQLPQQQAKQVSYPGIPASFQTEANDDGSKATVDLTVEPVPEETIPAIVEASYSGPSENLGYRYRIPGAVTFKLAALNNDNKYIAASIQSLTVAQAGVVRALPAGTKAPGTVMKVALYPDTGALKEASVLTEPLNEQLIKDAGASVAEALGAIAAARAAAQPPPSALAEANEELGSLKTLMETVLAIRGLGGEPPAAAVAAMGTGAGTDD